MHNFYERKEYPTLNRLLQVLKEKMEDGFLCGSFDEDLFLIQEVNDKG